MRCVYHQSSTDDREHKGIAPIFFQSAVPVMQIAALTDVKTRNLSLQSTSLVCRKVWNVVNGITA
jgi:hypothetical protein